jgi:hypothetical protein
MQMLSLLGKWAMRTLLAPLISGEPGIRIAGGDASLGMRSSRLRADRSLLGLVQKSKHVLPARYRRERSSETE